MPFYANLQTDPKRSFRFLFFIAGAAGNGALQPYTVKQVKKPTFQLEGGPQIKYIQHAFKYPGRVVWQDVSLTVVDPGGSEDAGAALMNALATSGYAYPRDANNSLTKQSISKSKANEGIGKPRIQQIDARGEKIDEWTLNNAFISQVDFGEVSYESDDIVNISLTIMYDWATYRTFHNGKPVVPAVSTPS